MGKLGKRKEEQNEGGSGCEGKRQETEGKRCNQFARSEGGEDAALPDHPLHRCGWWWLGTPGWPFNTSAAMLQSCT